ncbi:MAG TPA: DUF1552 domain-containing protein, partial [Polyangiaceae bacterium LLY-WYZ-15_(1-7)]|nr:DUF1552 domain-containing protein [Polyangiaceae bacterium LLY-WYZ-15_(1-7)]
FDHDDPLRADGPLSPLRPHLSKIAVLRGIDMHTGGGHPRGGGATFTGFEGREDTQRGPSIDVVAMRDLHREGPPTPLSTLLVTSGFRRDHQYRRVHSWNEDGSPMGNPIERPSDLFERLFGGGVPDPVEDPAEARRRRYRRSVLDTVLDDYRHFASERSGLSADSRRRIADHLERIRELERRIFPPEGEEPPMETCAPGDAPGDPSLPYGREATEISEQLDAGTWIRTQALLADLYAMALRCDLVRFGNITFQASGDRVRLRGDYDYNGRTITFDDRDHHHEYWHRRRFPEVEHHTHYIMRQFGYLLGALDDPASPDANGQTLLENMLFMIGAELGDGSAHHTRNTFHVISGANERLRTGGLIDVDSSSVNVYNTCLQALGVGRVMGDERHYAPGALDSVLRR